MKPSLAGKKIAVYGLARSGLSAIRLLLRERANVTAVDRATPEALGATVTELVDRGVRLHLGGGDPGRVLLASDLIVLSPGVPQTLPEVVAAQEAGVEVIGEVELAWRFIAGQGPMLGITGTNGKSTTTALTGKLLECAGRRVFVGGNLGRPLSEAALEERPYQAFVVELSSFQLEGATTLRCHGAAILNLTPDHIDRYASMAEYGGAKARILRNQRADDFFVLNADDAAVVALADAAQADGAGAARLGFTLEEDARKWGQSVAAARCGDGFTFRGHTFAVRNRALRGAHNLQNAMAAALLAGRSGLGVSDEHLQRGLDEYPGLPHRIESVATIRGVEWVNDSKATNVDSTLVGLAAFPKNVWLILGGKGKGAPYEPLVQASLNKVKGVLTIGQDAPTIEAAYAGRVPVHACQTIEGAVQKAKELSREGDVVLLSPACASYDQFRNFEHRGEVFKALVRSLS
ncbi:MAG: UDP-N-acetylmuramoyl-L-alanine--D-glutamate ligase [Myxococcaceae bacterium]|nr:UDP-N-acetylmuramoyl-L-alanine--D-glutamate ligase [Myxococcaceae bacterium]